MIGLVVAHIRSKDCSWREIEQVEMRCEYTTSAVDTMPFIITLVLFTLLALHVRALTVANVVRERQWVCLYIH